MTFFNALEKIDKTINKCYACCGKWIWGGLLAVVLAYGSWLIWAAVWGPPTGGGGDVNYSQ